MWSFIGRLVLLLFKELSFTEGTVFCLFLKELLSYSFKEGVELSTKIGVVLSLFKREFSFKEMIDLSIFSELSFTERADLSLLKDMFLLCLPKLCFSSLWL